MTQNQQIDLEKGWMVVQKVITKLKESPEGEPPHSLKPEEYMEVYNTIYDLCLQERGRDNNCRQLYNRYRETLENYLSSTVVPQLREKHGESMLEELVQRWSNHKTMVRSLSRCFRYLDRFFTSKYGLPTLTQAGLNCFRDEVFGTLNGEVVDAVITLYEQEREKGKKIDRSLYKNVADVVSLINQERDEGEESQGVLLKNVADVIVRIEEENNHG